MTAEIAQCPVLAPAKALVYAAIRCDLRPRPMERVTYHRLVEQLAACRWPLAGTALVFAALVAASLVEPVPGLVSFAAISLILLVARARDIALAQSDSGDGDSGSTDPFELAYSISSALPDPAVLIDRGDAIIYQNDKANAVLGRRERGQHISSALRDPEILDALRRVRETGETVRVDHVQQVPIPRHFEVFLAPIKPAGGVAVPDILLIMRDLTRQERIERMRADFVAYASHELRTPLASLIGFVETLQGPARDDPKARDRFLAIMRVEAARMSRLIDDLLSLSRIELNAHVPPTRTVDLAQIVGHVIDTLTPLADDSGVEIIGPVRRAPLEVAGDYDELVQVFQNLIENAIKYGQSGGRVEIELGPAAIDMRGEPVSGVVVSVRDFGPGIAPEHIPRLTERFYRVDASHSREKGGTGLGLAIVKHILNRHRGSLAIDSALGAGSTFVVSLPLASESHKSEAKSVA